MTSVDAKKQNVGSFKNDGREWRPGGDPVKVSVYDFLDMHKGTVPPTGCTTWARTLGG